MSKVAARVGHPIRWNYDRDARCQLNIEIRPSLKLAISETAEANGRRLSEEVRLALKSWVAEEGKLGALA